MAHMMTCKRPPLKELNVSALEAFEFSRKVMLPKILTEEIIKPSWDKCTKDGDGVQAFLAQNIGAFGWNGQLEDFHSLILTNGTLPPPYTYDIEMSDEPDGENDVCIMWFNNDMKEDDERMDDEICYVIFSNDLVYLHTGNGKGRKRRDEYVNVTIPYGSKDKLKVFAFFRSKDGSDYSLAWYKEV
ncbi:hypothetical protein EYV94_20700 [Puteibacter caeruleilacunae]|nr:hypothetical protein EYV94_20700 [Puteibacter caeruleilacunae]